jgi:hypothetical protein
MSEQEQRQPTEEEMRAAYEAELKRLRVEDVVLQTIVSLLNLGGRKAGLAPGTEEERDLEQVRVAVDGARALLPLVEAQLGPDAGQLREALSQLQMAYVQLGGKGGGGAAPPSGGGGGGGPGDQGGPGGPPPQAPGGPGEGQRSGRIWVPGQ